MGQKIMNSFKIKKFGRYPLALVHVSFVADQYLVDVV